MMCGGEEMAVEASRHRSKVAPAPEMQPVQTLPAPRAEHVEVLFLKGKMLRFMKRLMQRRTRTHHECFSSGRCFQMLSLRLQSRGTWRRNSLSHTFVWGMGIPISPGRCAACAGLASASGASGTGRGSAAGPEMARRSEQRALLAGIPCGVDPAASCTGSLVQGWVRSGPL